MCSIEALSLLNVISNCRRAIDLNRNSREICHLQIITQDVCCATPSQGLNFSSTQPQLSCMKGPQRYIYFVCVRERETLVQGLRKITKYLLTT